jgi:rRNA-processing protein FCF1
MPLSVLLDTNFILLPLELGRDIKSELDNLLDLNYNLMILNESIDELKKIKLKHKHQDNIDFIKEIWGDVKIIKSPDLKFNNVDEKIFNIAMNNQFIVATNDMDLRRRLRKYGLATIFLRKKRHIMLDTPKPLSEYLRK